MINNLTKLLSNSNTSAIKNQSTVYNFNKQNNVSIGPGWKNRVNLILISYFKKFYCLISKPVFVFTPNKVSIHLFYYKREVSSSVGYRNKVRLFVNKYSAKLASLPLPVNELGSKRPLSGLVRALNSRRGRLLFLPNSRLKFLAILLSKLLKTNVELEVVRLKYPYHDSNILAQLIGINGKKLTYGRIKKILFSRATIFTKAIETKSTDTGGNLELDLGNKEIASQLTGIKIRISGRLARQRVVPKRTVKTAYKGGISKSKNNLVDSSTYTSKNKKGAFSVRVHLSHSI